MTFLELAREVLENSNTPLNGKEIWAKAVEMGLDKELPVPTKGERLTPWASIEARMYVNIRDKDDSPFVKVRGRMFWLKSKGVVQEAEIEKLEEQSISFSEKDMHPKLVSYLFESNKIYSKTIRAQRTSKPGENKWKAPDIVGVKFYDEYDDALLTMCNRANIPTMSLYAYELKKSLSLRNYTEYFMQVISNSSWANESWLVVADLDTDPDFRKELERLNQSFGIGVLRLDMNDPIGSEIVVSARKSVNLDLDTMNLLCKTSDYKDFIKTINSLLREDVRDRNNMLKRCINNKEFDKPEETA